MLPVLLAYGTLMTWLLLALSAIVIVVFIERLLHYHRAQINSMEFLNGVRNVLKRDNVVEALSICEATPGTKTSDEFNSRKMATRNSTPTNGEASSCPRKILALRGNFMGRSD